MPESLYIHIPFCLRKCIYCDFVSVPLGDESLTRGYIQALIREIGLCGGLEKNLKTLYIGGGTPTVLPPGELEELLSAINSHFEFQPGAELTIEANPASVDAAKLGLLHTAGINRISIGVQSFNDAELKLLGRLHTGGEASEAICLARAAGFENISLDLIYGIPGQTAGPWRKTLEAALALAPEHISAYELTVEKHTCLWEMVQKGVLKMLPEEEILTMQETAARMLGEAGFIHYEVSNYARPQKECRHNLNYWERGQYLGLGAAAHSFAGERRWKNTGGINEYIEALSGGKLPRMEAEDIRPEEAKRELVFLGLRLEEGIPLAKARAYGLRLEDAAKGLCREGFLEIKKTNSSGHLRATKKGFSVLNRVIEELIGELGL
ncbi:MAG: radical SAM family heme chaperone HemW [Nitrospiraceae bacterium]|nr:radical SAM family heme chaperone HemW [Nitrospiraceae bacterium]